jgi:hypothetical protein
MDLVGSDPGVGLNQLFDRPAIAEPFENDFDADARPLDLRLAADDEGIAVDVVTPIHGRSSGGAGFEGSAGGLEM